MRTVAVIIIIAMTFLSFLFIVIGLRSLTRTIGLGRRTSWPTTPVAPRVKRTLTEVFAQTRMIAHPLVGTAHWVVMVSFIILIPTLVVGYGQIIDPSFHIPLLGRFPVWEWITEFFAWAGLLGIVAFIIVRWIDRLRGRESRFFKSHMGWALFVELTITIVTACILVLRGLSCVYDATSAATQSYATALHYPLTSWLDGYFTGDRGEIGTAISAVAFVKVFVSLLWLCVIGLIPRMGVAWHRFLAPINIYARRNADGRLSLGELQPMTIAGEEFNIETAEDMPDSVTQISDFSHKALFDFTSCTECGRCQDACPSWISGEPLSPKLLMMSLRDENFRQSAQAGEPRALVGSVVSPDALWSCTTCGACVAQCPVDIEHVDHIVDLRRAEVLERSAQSSELTRMFKNLESTGNPWGMANDARMDWAKDLDFPVPLLGVDADPHDIDYLLWIGCAGAFEPRARSSIQSLAKLLHAADVKFAVLGKSESCTGDPARRSGNEVLYQLLAQRNIDALNAAGVLDIVTSCAHCFNTFSREYPQLGGTYRVLHHSQLLNRLVREGRLTPHSDNSREHRIAFHDPCYLGRHNDVYDEPREIIDTIAFNHVDFPRSRENSFCCGAGGARMWNSTEVGKEISHERAQEIAKTHVEMVVTGCPYCQVMLSDSASYTSGDGHPVEVRDIANLLWDAVNNREH